MANYTECKKIIIVLNPAFFRPFLKAPAKKLISVKKIGYTIWAPNCIFFFKNTQYGGFKKLVFRLFELFLNLEQAHFRPFLKVQEKNLIPHSQIRFKNWLNNVNCELYFFKSYGDLKKKSCKKNPGKITILSRCCHIYFERKKCNSESALYYKFLKLIWECGISFAA